MTESIAAFEAELLQKIQFKSSSKTSMDAFLFKNMRFFDLQDKGLLSKLDFFKAIAKCGVVVDTYDIDQLWHKYAAEDGKVHYRKFIQQLLFREEQIQSNASRLKSTHPPKPQPLQQNVDNQSSGAGSAKQSRKKLAESKIQGLYSKCQTYGQTLDFIKRQLQDRGANGLLSMAVNIKASDPKKQHVISRKALQSILPFLQKNHLDLIFSQLSQNGQDIDYSVLIYDLKGQVEDDRLKEIEGTFNLLDDRREGEFPINYMLSRFLSKSQKQNFQSSVKLYSKFQGIDDGVFTEDDFLDCLGFISFDFNSNEAFKGHVIRPFYEQDRQSISSQRSNRSRDFPNKSQVREELVQQPPADFRKNKDGSPILSSHEKRANDQFEDFYEQKDEKKSVSRYSHLENKEVSSSQLRDIESIILRIKKRLATKGTKGFLTFEKALKSADINRDTLLNYEQFKQVIKEQRIDITNTEIDHIFNIFDEQCTNLISFPEFIFTIRGKMPENRREFLDRLWDQVRLSEETTNFGKIKKAVNFRNHPDVQNGRKHQEDIWKEIQQTILIIQQLNGSARSDTIAKAEFDQYLENLSLSIIDDRLYESILHNFWRVDSSTNISEKYAGSRKVFENTKNCYLLDHHRYVVKGGSVSQNAPFGTSHEPTAYFTEHGKL